MTRGAGMLMALVLAGAVALPARADAPASCLTPAADIAALTAALEGEGWSVLPEGPLPDDAADRLAWPLVAYYATSDTGGQSLAELYALQRRTVEGLPRRRDVEGAATRLLTREGGAMTATLRDVPDGVELRCRVALDGEGSLPVAVVAERPVRHGDAMVTVTRLSPEKLSQATGVPASVAEVIETRLVYDPEDGS